MNNFFIYLPHKDGDWNKTLFFDGTLGRDLILWRGTANPIYYKSYKEAVQEAKKINKIISDYCQEQKKELFYVEVGNLTKLNKTSEFENSFPLDADHIPDEDKDIELINRFGQKSGVVTNFLRQEMLKGNMMVNPELKRWYYIPDSLFLQCKKSGLH